MSRKLQIAGVAGLPLVATLLVASPTMDAAQLGAEMRTIRPDVEHVTK